MQCENFCTATVISTLPYRCLQPPSISSFLSLSLSLFLLLSFSPFPCFIVAQFHRERKKDVYAGCTHSGENRGEQRRWRVSILRSWKCDCLSSPSFFLSLIPLFFVFLDFLLCYRWYSRPTRKRLTVKRFKSLSRLSPTDSRWSLPVSRDVLLMKWSL